MGQPVRVMAEMGVFAHEIETEDAAVAVVRFANGALGSLSSSTATFPEHYRIIIYGELGSVAAPWRLSLADSHYQAEVEQWLNRLPRPEHGGHTAVIADFLRAVRLGERPTVDGTEGRRSVELAIAIYKSALTGQPVPLPLSPDDPFYTKQGIMEAAKASAENKR
jgi:predicted dehydrogenase